MILRLSFDIRGVGQVRVGRRHLAVGILRPEDLKVDVCVEGGMFQVVVRNREDEQSS